LLSQYYAAIDDKQLEVAVVASTFTPNGRLINPAGTSLTGHSAIAADQTTAFRRFKATHVTGS
jgi:hypothetical protein